MLEEEVPEGFHNHYKVSSLVPPLLHTPLFVRRKAVNFGKHVQKIWLFGNTLQKKQRYSNGKHLHPQKLTCPPKKELI